MSEVSKPQQIAWGTRAAMQAEYGTLPVYKGRYLVQPIGNGNWDAEGFDSKREARAEVKAQVALYSVSSLWVA